MDEHLQGQGCKAGDFAWTLHCPLAQHIPDRLCALQDFGRRPVEGFARGEPARPQAATSEAPDPTTQAQLRRSPADESPCLDPGQLITETTRVACLNDDKQASRD